MALTYELLLDLYRGRATAVEQITDEAQLRALAVETPITRLLQDLDRRDAPRHVVLTGSAGDGKTFAALTADTTTFKIITDASARRPGSDAQPVDDLADQIEEALLGHRLLLAINRGQLERLFERTKARGGVVAAFAAEVRDRALIRDAWGSVRDDVAVADLGWLDRAGAARAIIQKVAALPPPLHLASATREAFRLACTSLGDGRVADWVTSVVTAATAAGANVTMRQLWSFVAYLATGARAPGDATPVSPIDAVGARLFDPAAEGPLFAVALERCDPSLTPNARLAREILTGDLLNKARASPLGALFAVGCEDGRTLARIAAVHQIGVEAAPPAADDHFAKATALLAQQPPGPQPLGAYPRTLLKGIYKALGLWSTANTLPAWQTLCFDSSRVAGAAAVADNVLSAQAFKLALPRPPPDVAPYVAAAWRPPFVWLCGPGDRRLRLPPRTFRALLSGAAAARDLESADLFAFETWLRQVGAAKRGADSLDGAGVRVSRREHDSCVVLEQGLSGKVTVSLQ